MKKVKAKDRTSVRSLHKKLVFAIIKKRLVRITYHGVVRIGEPHDYGIQRSIAKLLFYQLQAMSDEGHRWKAETGWRMLEVTKIESCILSPKVFPGSRGSSHRKHLAWDELFARVK